jgi:hypothetical protein
MKSLLTPPSRQRGGGDVGETLTKKPVGSKSRLVKVKDGSVPIRE